MEETRGYQPYSMWISPSRFTVSASLSYTHTTRNRPATKRSAFGLYVLTMLYDTSLESSSSHPMQLSQNNAYFGFRAHNSPIRQYTQSMAMARVCAAEPPIWHDVPRPHLGTRGTRHGGLFNRAKDGPSGKPLREGPSRSMGCRLGCVAS